MNIQTKPPVPLDDIEYPESDGKPMAENTLQFLWITYLKENFDYLFRDRADVFVAGDLLWYPVQGNNVLCTAPDTMIAFGRPKGHRGSYMQWVEGHVAPQVVWEVLSPGNRAGELADKFDFYEQYGIEEYYQYDPDRGELRGWLRADDRLRPIATIRGWISPRTGVRLDLQGDDLVIVDPAGNRFKTYEEVRTEDEQERAARLAAEKDCREMETSQTRAEQERKEAEARAERLAAKLRALGIDPDAE
jgi:Uma2 family endonuclease